MQKLFALLSGSDARTALLAILSGAGVLTYIGLAIGQFVRAGAFDPQNYGIGLGISIVAAAGGMGLHDYSATKADKLPDQGGGS